MTVVNTDAPSAKSQWDSLPWEIIEIQVKRLQMRIAKATRENRHRKANALQWLMTHSFYAKVMAVKRVTQNRGNKIPGIDKVTWNTPRQKMDAVHQLRRKDYRTLPLRRIYIPKANGKLRPLSIPTMRCRAMQALHLLALEPIAETIADKNAYGFRPKRSCADAIEQCYIALARKYAAQWVLEGDIKSCFDKISHQWLLDNIPMDKMILKKWLSCGYIDQQQLHATIEGVPQGSIIAPTMLTITLAGLEKAVKAAVNPKDKVNLITYADDFIITGASKEVLETVIKPVVISFLKTRGLELSEEKTLTTHISQGFDFLGFNVRKYGQKLLTKPAKKNVKEFVNTIRADIKANATAKTETLINLLNPKIRGWANYYRHGVSKATFSKVDCDIFKAIWAWSKRRHPCKGQSWIKNKYFCRVEHDNWVFNAGLQPAGGRYKLLRLMRTTAIPIVRHIKVRAEAQPYDPKYYEYFESRARRKIKAYFNEIAGSEMAL
jgi:RNA-directed DNA polymerase